MRVDTGAELRVDAAQDLTVPMLDRRVAVFQGALGPAVIPCKAVREAFKRTAASSAEGMRSETAGGGVSLTWDRVPAVVEGVSDFVLKQRAEGRGIEVEYMHPNRLPAADSSGADKLVADLIELHLLDAICGQTDRGSQNFFFRERPEAGENNVFGIDLDMAFGALATPPRGQLAHLPPFVSTDTDRRIRSLTAANVAALLAVFPAAVRPVLFEEALLARLAAVQTHLAALGRAGNVVELAAFPEKRALLTVTNSYYAKLSSFNAAYRTDACTE